MRPSLHVSYILPESTFPCINFWQMKVDENHKQYNRTRDIHIYRCTNVCNDNSYVRYVEHENIYGNKSSVL